MMKISSCYNARYGIYETVRGVSMTEPNQSYTIKQILQRYVAGQPLPTHHGEYDDDGTLPDAVALEVLPPDDDPDVFISAYEAEKQAKKKKK